MIKHVVAFLLLLIPTVVMANDQCTNPSEYTIDRRCYVTDEQKQVKPYNAVVAIVDTDTPYVLDMHSYHSKYCSGTIVQNNGQLYVYTARHCVTSVENGAVDERIAIRLHDGRVLDANKYQVGNFDYDQEQTWGNDWAVYKIVNASADIPYVGMSVMPSLDVRSLGYGVLKVMSDQDLWAFKQNYLEYLYKNPSKMISNDLGFRGEGVYLYNDTVLEFVQQLDYAYRKDVFGNNELKVSECKYDLTNQPVGCQGWDGDSGGGLFDVDGNLVAIQSIGAACIGGGDHGKATDYIVPEP